LAADTYRVARLFPYLKGFTMTKHNGTHPTRTDDYGMPLVCLHSDGIRETCEGDVDQYPALSGTGTLITYCETHYGEAWERHFEIMERYPVHAPADFDPDYCGERWDDDY
jgi:hypothetical protein